MEVELDRLRAQAEALERDWHRIPFLFVFWLTAIPAYFMWGVMAMIYALLLTPCMVIAAFYLVGVRRAETKHYIAEMRRDLARAGE